MIQSEFEDLFAKFGKFRDAAIAIDRYTNSSKGFGFITFDDDDDGRDAIESIHGKVLENNDERPLKV